MSRDAVRVPGIVSRGLKNPAERWCLAASVALCLAYLAALAFLHQASTRIDESFLARRDAVRLSHLLQHRMPLGVPVIDTDARVALLNGWSVPENWGVWSDGAYARPGPRPATVAAGLPRCCR